MTKIKNAIFNFIKKEIVLSVAIIITVVTCFFVPIDKEYIKYFDCNTLVCLFCMLVVVAGLKSTNAFELISRKMIGRFHTRRGVIYALVFGTF
ncbi:MAG: citrate transporter, partial [Ruminococcus sp.]|nr:citrate transporter [Ruminococcus sp.]